MWRVGAARRASGCVRCMLAVSARVESVSVGRGLRARSVAAADWPWARPRVSLSIYLSIYLSLSATEPQGRLRRVGHVSQLPERHDGAAYHYRRALVLVPLYYS